MMILPPNMIRYENEIQDNGSLHHYRTEIPNIIFQLNLDPWTFKAYCVFKMTAGDKGSCFKSNSTLACEIGCRVPTLIKLKRSLEDQGLITITKRKHEKGGDMPDLIHIVDIWPQNMHQMSKLYPRNPKNDLLPWNTEKLNTLHERNDNSKLNEGGTRDLSPGVNGVKGGSKRGLPKQEHKEEEQKEQQHAALAAAVFSDSKDEDYTKPPIWWSLREIELPLHDKYEITKRYDEETVNSAVAWATHPQTVITKGLVQAIKWACQTRPEIPKNKEDVELVNKTYAFKYDGLKNKNCEIVCCNKYVEIVLCGNCEPKSFKYDEKSFMENFNEALKSCGFKILQ